MSLRMRLAAISIWNASAVQRNEDYQGRCPAQRIRLSRRHGLVQRVLRHAPRGRGRWSRTHRPATSVVRPTPHRPRLSRWELRPGATPIDLEEGNCSAQDWQKPTVGPTVAGFEASRFGETTMTDTVEGVDQVEIATFDASPFGETTLTRTHEGADQSEGAVFEASQYGETTLTKTSEGADQAEITSLSDLNATYSHF